MDAYRTGTSRQTRHDTFVVALGSSRCRAPLLVMVTSAALIQTPCFLRRRCRTVAARRSCITEGFATISAFIEQPDLLWRCCREL